MKLGFLLLLPLLVLALPVQADPSEGDHSGYKVTDKNEPSFPQNWNMGSYDFGPGFGGPSDSGGFEPRDDHFPWSQGNDGGHDSAYNFGPDPGFPGQVWDVFAQHPESWPIELHDHGNKWPPDFGNGPIYDHRDHHWGKGSSGPHDPTSVNAVPEPSTWALLIGSLAGLALFRRLRFSKR